MNTKIIELDVRQILAGGVDPFEAIMAKLKELNNDQSLLIINTFEPIPLLNIIKDKGFVYETKRHEDGVVYTTISMNPGNKVETDNIEQPRDAIEFCDIQNRYSGKMTEIDVRDLEMPLPMVTILEEIEKLADDNALFVHHKRLPQYLLPELEERGYSYVFQDIDDDNLNLIIYK